MTEEQPVHGNSEEMLEYVIEEGDDIETLARDFNTSVDEFKELNPDLDLQQIAPGQRVRVPFPLGPCEGTIYIIRRGDTLSAIAQRFNVTVEAILQANLFLNPNRLRVGLPICIPTSVQPCRGFFYVVQGGDTIFSLARRFNTTVEAILQANPGLDPNRLTVGQRICIPTAPPPPCPGVIYTVMAGDTIFSIAARFRTTVTAILQANPGLDPNRLIVGQQICIPTVETPCPGFIYTVVLGDTLFTIANRFGTTVAAILQANPGLDPNMLFVGQRICIPVLPPPPCPGFTYTVVAGDTLNAIARRFNTSVEAILQANPGLDPNRIFIGQQICIPVPQPPICPGFIYTIQPGDTLFAIAGRYRTTVTAILQANPGLDPNRLFVGQQICIPVPEPPVCPGFTYTIVAGDTLFAIAQRFNTTVEAILQANPGLDPNRLFIGQQICIPVPRPPVCPGFTYTIAPGDTLFGIANRFGTTVTAILQANPGLDPNRLTVGQQICIPVSPPAPCPGFIYIVVAGDTLFSIAQRYNTTVDAILRANPGLDPNRLVVGVRICIPV